MGEALHVWGRKYKKSMYLSPSTTINLKQLLKSKVF